MKPPIIRLCQALPPDLYRLTRLNLRSSKNLILRPFKYFKFNTLSYSVFVEEISL